MWDFNIVEVIQILSDVMVGVSALIVAILGIIGLTQWKAELKGRSRYEVAKRLAFLALKYRELLQSARSPFTFPSEWASRPKGENESPQEGQILDEYYARAQRLKKVQEVLWQLLEASWEARVVLGPEVTDLVEPLERSFREITSCLDYHFQMRLEALKAPRARRTPEEKRCFRIIYGTREDEFFQELTEAVTILINSLEKYL